MRWTPRRLRGPLALVAVLAVLGPLPVGSGQTAATCPGESRRTREDGWVQLRDPGFANPDLELVDYAVMPFIPNVMFATNGESVQRSTDGGCAWEQVYTTIEELAELITSEGPPIVALEVPPSVPGRLPLTVYLVQPQDSGTAVIKSNDLGASWDDTTLGLPLFSEFHRLRVSANPRIAYLLADSNGPNSLIENSLYVTRDGGVTWASVSTRIPTTSEPGLTDIAVDPVDPRIVWGWNESQLFRSLDSGVTFLRVRGVASPIGVVDVQRYPPYLPSRVMAFHKERAEAARSTDGGTTFRQVRSNGVVRSAANVYQIDAIATASDQAVEISAPGRLPRPLDVTPRGLQLTDLAFGLSGQLSLFGRDGSDIYRRRFQATLQPVPAKPRKLPPVNLTGPVVANIKESRLEPSTAGFSLLPGQSAVVRYRLDLAPTPTPLDIMFATDSTGSMSDVLASLRQDFQDIVNDLADSGIDVWFGVGDFQDYPAFSGGGYPWKRGREVGPIDDDLRAAIEGIQAQKGVTYDSSLAASYQAASGEGQRAVPGVEPPGGADYLIEPGQGAEWRPKAVKVIVMAADVRSRDPQTDPGYPGPSYRQVINKLNSLGVKQVGLAVGPQADNEGGARITLTRVAEGTRTVAPVGGTDCDDDKEIDIPEGEALVCSFSPQRGGRTSIAPAIVSLVRALQDLQTVGLELTADSRVVRLTSAASVDDINVKEPHQLAFDVEFRCDLETMGETYTARLRAIAGERSVDTASATVTCLRPEDPRIEVPPVVVAAAVAPLPPPPPPAPVPQPNPNPNPNPNPQPQAQTQPQAGLAQERQAQAQLALAHIEAGVEWDEETELAMVGREGVEERAARDVLWVGMALAAAAGVAVRRRQRIAPARAPALAGRTSRR